MKEDKLKKEKASIEELNAKLLNLLHEQFNLHIRVASNQLKQTHLLSQIRRDIARIKTSLTLKKRSIRYD